jgi:DNA-binding response OmpR family regulator
MGELKMNILLVEDDLKLGPLIEYKLKKEFHTTDWVTDAKTAESYFSLGHYDVYIFDWMLPDGTGIELCQLLRKQNDNTPILMLTAKDAVADRVNGLKHGADDYLIKPFAFEELTARIEALGRRKDTSWNDDMLQFGELNLRLNTHKVIRGDVPIHLSRREFQLLGYLMKHPKQILSREQIMNAVWGLAEVTPNTVDATIKQLRKKVDAPYSDKYLHSYRGIGYSIGTREQ